MKIFLLFFLCCMLVFAIHKEYRDQPNCYLEAIPVKTDSKAVLLKKIQYCLDADSKTVKWRRSLIGAMSFLFLYSILVKVPSYKETLLIVLVFYFIYYSLWMNYMNTISSKVSKIGKNIILKIKKC